jgi:hypothetical protein
VLMRDGGGLSIRGGLRPDHRGEIRATCNLAENKRQVKGVEGGREGGRDLKKKIIRNLGTKDRVSDSREGE